MRCPDCRTIAQLLFDNTAGEEGIRRTYNCSQCSHRFSTLEVAVAPATGRDAARKQAAAIRGEPFVPTKNFHTLKLEAQAESPEFRWGIIVTYPCTVAELAKTLGLRLDATARRLEYLWKKGDVSRRESRAGPTNNRAFEYSFIPSHKRKGVQGQEEAA
jgi:hypothetical protein